MTATVSRASGRPAHGYGFASTAKMEWLKLRSLRSGAWITAITVAGVIGVGIAVLSYYPSHWAHLPAADKAAFDPTNNGFAGVAIAQLAFGIAGVIAMTAEYSSGSISSTLAAVPRRPLVLVAKAAVLGTAALIVGELSCIAAFTINQYVVLSAPAPHASLGDPTVLRAVLLTGAYVALIGLLGLGVGAI